MVYDDIVDFPKNYKGPKLSGIIVGGGYSFFDIMRYPGASAVIENISCPYGEASIHNMIPGIENYVCKETNEQYLDTILDTDCLNFVVSAKLTTNRARKGTNECVISISRSGSSVENHWLLSFNKLADDMFKDKAVYDTKRFMEDQQIGMTLCNLLCGKTSIIDHTMFADTPLGRISSIVTIKSL